MVVTVRNVGVFIDADNLPARVAKHVLDLAGCYGRIVERRVYGDFTRDALRPWADAVPVHALSLQTGRAAIAGKNSSDILLAVDVTELMYRSEIDIFRIASSDSDFGHLATRLRMRGHHTIGLGEKKAADIFRLAFDEFFELDVESRVAAKPPVSKVVALKRPGDIRPYVVQAINFLGSGPSDWVDLSRLGSAIRQLNPEFAVKDFGSAKFSTLLKNCTFLENRMNDANQMQIRIRPQPRPETSQQGKMN